jgi:uncharacterized protein (DUF983 family)
MTIERIASQDPTTVASWPVPDMPTAIGRGLKGHCPACGKGRMFLGFLTVTNACPDCGAPLGLARADDAPRYLTILLVAHIVIPLVYIVDRLGEPPLWVMTAIFVPLSLALALGLLRPIKGGTVGVLVNLNMLTP